MKLFIAIASISFAVALVADQHRQKVESGGDGWWDWHSRDAPGLSMATSTIWSHDAWAFVAGVLVPTALVVSSLGSR